MKLVEYTDSEVMWMALSQAITGELKAMLLHEDRASIAVPGGTTPGPLYDVLHDVSLDWGRVDVMLTDERWVAEDHPRSNTAMLRDRLFRGAAAAANLVPLRADTDTPEESLGALTHAVRGCLPLTVVLLGMGEDMHTASLFPRADKLATALSPKAPALVAMRAPGADEPRITLSARALNGAMSKHLVIVGDAKRSALEKAVEIGDAFQAPVSAVMDDLTVHWAPV